MNIAIYTKELSRALAMGIALSLAATACSDDEAGIADSASLRPGSVSVGLYGEKTRAEATDDGYTPLLKGKVGISLQSGGDNLPYTYGTPWTAVGERIRLTGNTSSLAAYYPYDGRTSGDVIYSGTGESAALNMIPTLYAEGKDLCAGNFGATEVDYAPKIQLRHLYARVSFRFVRYDTYKGAGKISELTVTGPISAQYKLFARDYVFKDKDEIPFAVSLTAGDEDDAVTAGNTADLLLVPDTDISGGIPFSFVIDAGTEYEATCTGTIPASLFGGEGNTSLHAGYHYHMKMSLGDGYTVQGVPEDGGWNEGTLEGDYGVEVE